MIISKFDLQEALDMGIIDMQDVLIRVEMKKQEELLAKHPYEIWQGNNGSWYTYLPDEKKGRVQRQRKTEKEIKSVIIEYWKQELENPTIKDIYDEWMELKLQRGEISRATKNRYDRQYCESMMEFGKRRIKSISECDIEDFILQAIKEHSLTQKGYSNLRTLIYGIFKRAKKRKLIDFSITEVISDMEISRKVFRKNNKPDEDLVFTEEEVPKIIDCIMKSERDILDLGILLLFKTGLRPGELAGLEICDVVENIIHVCRTEIHFTDDHGNNVYEVRNFPKTEAGIRDVIVPKDSLWILKDIRKQNPFGQYLFEKNGNRIKTYMFSQRLETICKRSGIKPKSLNKIRKTYGSILIDGKVAESLIISQMGHTNIKTTKSYYYKDRKSTQQKIEVIDRVAGL